MPPIRSIILGLNTLSIRDHRGVARTLNASAIPSQQNTVARVETWINTVWIPANISGYQAVVHVFSLNPLHATIWTGDLDVPLPVGDWWEG